MTKLVYTNFRLCQFWISNIQSDILLMQNGVVFCWDELRNGLQEAVAAYMQVYLVPATWGTWSLTVASVVVIMRISVTTGPWLCVSQCSGCALLHVGKSQ